MSDVLSQEECHAKKSKHKKKKRKRSNSADDVDNHSEKETTNMEHQTKLSPAEDIYMNGGSKKNKKRKNINDGIPDGNKTDENNEILSENIKTVTNKIETECIRKKKRKKKHVDSIDKGDIEHDLSNSEENKKRKTLKQVVTVSESTEFSLKSTQEPCAETDALNTKNKKQRKNKKHAKSKSDKENHQCVEPSEGIVLHLSMTETDTCHEQKKRKRKKDKKPVTDVKRSENNLESGEGIEQMEANCNKDEIKTKRKKKKKRKHKEIENGGENQNGETADSSVTVDAEATSSSVSKKKKEKKSRNDLECDENVPRNETQTADEASVSQKRSKKKKKILNAANNEKSSEISEHQNTDGQADDDSKTRSNTCNEKSQSGFTPATNTNSLGQWQTAALGDNDRQQKFLRLLGGFKKGDGSKGPFSKLGAKPKGGNLALNRTEEETLTKNLMSTFQKALDYKLNMGKGVGLGFTPPPGEGKKFHVDTNVIKSKKFDD